MAEKMYTKPGPFGSTLLYNSSGQLIGKGTTSSTGNTIYTGKRGEIVSKSSPGLFGGTKMFDSNNRYRGSSVNSLAHSKGDVTIFDCNNEE